MTTAADQTIRTDGELVNCIDHRAAPVMLRLHTPHESRGLWRAQEPVIAYAGFVPSSGTSAQSNPKV
jgi:hypothetical protein